MFDFNPLTILAAFAPVAVDAGKALVRRYITPTEDKPLTIAERLQVEQSDIERLKVIAELDRPGDNVSPWVQNVRALMRPSVALAVTLKWCVAAQTPGLDFMVSTVWFYLFGERTLRK